LSWLHPDRDYQLIVDGSASWDDEAAASGDRDLRTLVMRVERGIQARYAVSAS
jgi:hypothetical protein